MTDEEIEFLETEEIIEAGIVAALRAAEVPLEVIGALTPESDDVEKTATLSQIGVTVDTASQELDWQGPNLPCTYTARISVHLAFKDDKTESCSLSRATNAPPLARMASPATASC